MQPYTITGGGHTWPPRSPRNCRRPRDPLEVPSHAIGDMTAINDREFLVIERDNEQGATVSFKRIYKVSLDEMDTGGALRKELVAVLMQIADRAGLTEAEAGAIGLGSVFKFPFVTIESVYPLGERTLLVINDNNLRLPESLDLD